MIDRYLYDALRGELKALRRLIANLGIRALTGDITAGPGSGPQIATITTGSVTNAKMADMAAARLKGRAFGAGTGVPQDLTGTQATVILDVMVGANGAGGTKGLVPAPVAGDAAAGKFLKADATWAVPPGTGAGITELTGDVTAGPGTGSQAATIPNNTVTPAKMDDGSACSVLGRSANSGGDRADITSSADGQVLRRAGAVVGFGAVDLADSDAVTGLLPLANLAARTTSIQVMFDNGATAIAAGSQARGDVPVSCTLTKWRLLADRYGSPGGAIVMDVYKSTYANYPPVTSIVGAGTKPTLNQVDKNEDSTLTSYTTSFSAGDTWIVNIDSCTDIQQAVLILTFSY